MTADLARLEHVALRVIWPHEALDFTPWLLANSDVLSDGIGLDLEAAEHPVGGFSLDIIGVDRASGDRVIIENQLEGSDHLHLGQILTYAGGTNPANVVWVATSFREEHRAALEWLNERTDELTRFFAVQVSVVRIGDSSPAPLLTLVVQPNDWGKQVRASATGNRHVWSEDDFFEALSKAADTEVVSAARALYRHTRSANPDTSFYWGEGHSPGMTAQVPARTGRLQPWSFYTYGAPDGGPVFALNFDWIHNEAREQTTPRWRLSLTGYVAFRASVNTWIPPALSDGENDHQYLQGRCSRIQPHSTPSSKRSMSCTAPCTHPSEHTEWPPIGCFTWASRSQPRRAPVWGFQTLERVTCLRSSGGEDVRSSGYCTISIPGLVLTIL